MDWYNVKVDQIERLTEDSVRVDFRIDDKEKELWKFLAGQFLTFRKIHEGKEIRRSYSICSAPKDNILSVGIKEVEGGIFSTFANRTLKVGDTLECSPPQGHFYNEQEKQGDKSFVYIAAGSGITPILSMIKSTLQESEDSQVTLFFGNKNIRTIMFHEELEALKNVYVDRLKIYHVLSQQVQDSALLSGRIDGDKLITWDQVFFQIDETNAFFLCGPEAMILDVQATLKTKGIEDKKIKFELFTSDIAVEARKKRDLSDESSDLASVTVHLDGKNLDFEFGNKEDNILDAALSRGADLPFACKGGVCCTCRARLKEGEVEMYVNYGLEQEEIDAGFVLTCQAYPISNKVVIDFDDV